VPERELPTSFRDTGSTGWVREPLDEAVGGRRQVIVPPVTTLGAAEIDEAAGRNQFAGGKS
jgi:hypothetical protein